MHTLSNITAMMTAAEASFREQRGPALTTEFVQGDRFALELLLAVRREYGAEVVRWEPESFWALKDFSPLNRDKLLAAKTLATHPTLFTEPRGFAAIALTLSGFPLEPLEVAPVSPDAMAWAALEGELIYSLANPDSEEPEYGPDVTEYVALALFHEGYVVAPEMLAFADERLEQYLSEDGRALRVKVIEAWEKLSDNGLEEHAFPETAEGIQLARLAAPHVYCNEQCGKLVTALR